MNWKTPLWITRSLVIASVIFSIGSIAASHNLYPFLSYRLYTQPLGAKGAYTEYRIYSRTSDSKIFQRNSIKETPSYDYDSYLYMINYLTNESLKPGISQQEYKNKLLLFAKQVHPGQAEYKVVSETYYPSDLLTKKLIYDTVTVITF
jgi:hypothetical protein